MTPEEKAQLEKDYPQFNWVRMRNALLICGTMLIIVALST